MIIIFDNNFIFCVVIFFNARASVFIGGQHSNLVIRVKKMPGALVSFFRHLRRIKRDNKTGLSRYPYRPSDFFPSSRHIVPRTTNSSSPVVSVKQPLFHLVLPEYPRALSCSISKCRFYVSTPFLRSLSPFSNCTRSSLFLSFPLLFPFRSPRAISPLFFPYSIA